MLTTARAPEICVAAALGHDTHRRFFLDTIRRTIRVRPVLGLGKCFLTSCHPPDMLKGGDTEPIL